MDQLIESVKEELRHINVRKECFQIMEDFEIASSKEEGEKVKEILEDLLRLLPNTKKALQDPKVVAEIFKENFYDFSEFYLFLGKEYWENPFYGNQMLEEDLSLINFCPISIDRYKPIVREKIKKNPGMAEYFWNDKLMQMQDILLENVDACPELLNFIENPTEEMIQKALKGSYIFSPKKATANIRKHPQIFLKTMENYPQYFPYFSEEIKKNVDLIEKACEINHHVIGYVENAPVPLLEKFATKDLLFYDLPCFKNLYPFYFTSLFPKEQNKKEALDFIFSFILHQERFECDQTFCQYVKKAIKETNYSENYDEKKFDLLTSVFGYSVIKSLGNKNIVSCFSLPLDTLEKILSLFQYKPMEIKDAYAIMDIFYHEQFKKEQKEVFLYFPKLKEKYLMKQDCDVNLLLNQLFTDFLDLYHQNDPCLDPFLETLYFYEKEKKYSLEEYYKNWNSICLKQDSFEDFQNWKNECLTKNFFPYYLEKEPFFLQMLHPVINQMIVSKREKYKKEKREKIGTLLVLDYTDDPKKRQDLEAKKIIQKYQTMIINHKEFLSKNKNLEKFRYFFDHWDFFLDVLSFLSCEDKKTFVSKYPKQEITSKIKDCVKFLNAIKKEMPYQELWDLSLSRKEKKQIEKVTFLDHPKERLQIFKELNFPIFLSSVIKKEENYVYIKKLLDKYKFLSWNQMFQKLFPFVDSSFFATMIDSSYKLKEANEEKALTLFDVLNLTQILYSVSDLYSVLLGKDIIPWIKLNPNPNASDEKYAIRLKECAQSYVKMMKRKEITVPPMKEEIKINKKTMHITLGDVHNARNLILGELTGSCMRAHGPGDTLWKFCNENENGFHICFEDSKTGNFISRVSGFRNGNTIFLNELRHSVRKDLYTDQDLVLFLKEVANRLLVITKDSDYPIENVVISQGYAMGTSREPVLSFPFPFSNEGFPYFYTDIINKGIVLATTQTPYAPFSFSKENLPKYPILRREWKEYQKKDISLEINHLHLLEKALKEEEFYYEEMLPVESVYAFLGEDWYLYMDSNFEIHQKMIQDSSFAQKEIKEAYQKMKEVLNFKKSMEGEKKK